MKHGALARAKRGLHGPPQRAKYLMYKQQAESIRISEEIRVHNRLICTRVVRAQTPIEKKTAKKKI